MLVCHQRVAVCGQVAPESSRLCFLICVRGTPGNAWPTADGCELCRCEPASLGTEKRTYRVCLTLRCFSVFPSSHLYLHISCMFLCPYCVHIAQVMLYNINSFLKFP